MTLAINLFLWAVVLVLGTMAAIVLLLMATSLTGALSQLGR